MDLARFKTHAKTWELIGKRDPLFGVLSDATKQHGGWQEQEFFESGRAHVAKLFRILAEHGATFVAGDALDFGCGVGRLTQPIAERFAHAVGVDVSKSMVAIARRHNRHGDKCEYVVNTNPDLRQFKTGSFDLVHSCLVLQHIPPDASGRYVAEFMRVAKPGGLVVFQVPAQAFTEAEIDAQLTLPPDGYRASIQVQPVADVRAGGRVEVRLSVTNTSAARWPHDIPGGRHICIANHWRNAAGEIVIPDDGRARLPHDLAPGETGDAMLAVNAPDGPGDYLLEIDLVQEKICWFEQRGSTTAQVPVRVLAPLAPTPAPSAPETVKSEGLIARLRRKFRKPAPAFQMHVVPRPVIEEIVTANGGRVLAAINDGAADAGWLSYTYICRKSG
jgi:SAM-dependent methyltransferase